MSGALPPWICERRSYAVGDLDCGIPTFPDPNLLFTALSHSISNHLSITT